MAATMINNPKDTSKFIKCIVDGKDLSEDDYKRYIVKWDGMSELKTELGCTSNTLKSLCDELNDKHLWGYHSKEHWGKIPRLGELALSWLDCIDGSVPNVLEMVFGCRDNASKPMQFELVIVRGNANLFGICGHKVYILHSDGKKELIGNGNKPQILDTLPPLIRGKLKDLAKLNGAKVALLESKDKEEKKEVSKKRKSIESSMKNLGKPKTAKKSKSESKKTKKEPYSRILAFNDAKIKEIMAQIDSLDYDTTIELKRRLDSVVKMDGNIKCTEIMETLSTGDRVKCKRGKKIVVGVVGDLKKAKVDVTFDGEDEAVSLNANILTKC